MPAGSANVFLSRSLLSTATVISKFSRVCRWCSLSPLPFWRWGGRCPYDNTPIPAIVVCGAMGTGEYVRKPMVWALGGDQKEVVNNQN